MDISNKINNLIQIKSDLKSALLSKGVITSSTPFTDYPVAVNKLSKPVEMATLNFAFDNEYWVNLLSGDLKYASTSKWTSYFKIDGVDYWSTLLHGKWIWKDTTQTKFTVSVKVPKNKTITWELLAYVSTSTTEPFARVLYVDVDELWHTDNFYDYVTGNRPETGTVKITGESYTVNMKITFYTEGYGLYP